VTPHGLLLAAGAGTRMGMPKALVRDDDGTSWLLRSVGVLEGGGCAPLTVVLGAEAERAAALLDGHDVRVVVADRWAEGMGESLRAGLAGLAGSDADAVLVTLVDLPDVSDDVVRRVAGADPDAGPGVLARATYGGSPGHPVLLGRQHWSGVAETATGDRAARDYLATRDVLLVECGDLATGRDRDSP
jgi:CTP:molybdopterin cytidylyltransferase MocA